MLCFVLFKVGILLYICLRICTFIQGTKLAFKSVFKINSDLNEIFRVETQTHTRSSWLYNDLCLSRAYWIKCLSMSQIKRCHKEVINKKKKQKTKKTKKKNIKKNKKQTKPKQPALAQGACPVQSRLVPLDKTHYSQHD